MHWNTECLICGKSAQIIDARGEYQECACPDCGHYKVTTAVLTLMADQNYHFDVDKVRKWLIAHQCSGIIPIIDSQHIASLMRT